MIISLPICMIVSRFFLEFFLLIILVSFLVRIIKKNDYLIFKHIISKDYKKTNYLITNDSVTMYRKYANLLNKEIKSH